MRKRKHRKVTGNSQVSIGARNESHHENAGREEETDKGNEVASNINLVFLEAFLWGSDYVLS